MAFDYEVTLDTLEEVPQHVQGLYTKGDDEKFHLDESLAKRLDVTGLTSALDKERKNVKDLKGALNTWKALGDDPDTVKTNITEMQQQIEKKAGDGVNLDKIKNEIETRFQGEITSRDEKNLAMQQSLEKHMIANEARAVINEMKGAATLLLPHIKASTKMIRQDNGDYVVRVVDSEGDPRGDGKGGFMTIKDLVIEMKGHADYGRAFEAPTKGGGGTPPSKGPGGGTSSSTMSATQKIAAGLKKRGG